MLGGAGAGDPALLPLEPLETKAPPVAQKATTAGTCCIARSGKLDRARSRLYRSEILQENMRLKALAEIYTMHSFAQLCNLNFLSKFGKKNRSILQMSANFQI